MNEPGVYDAILNALNDLDDDAEVLDGGYRSNIPPTRFVEVMGEEPGDEKHIFIGKPNARERRYSIRIQTGVWIEGHGNEVVRQARLDVSELWEKIRRALLDVPIIDLVPSVVQGFDVAKIDQQPGYSSKSSACFIAGLVRVVERGDG